MKLPPGNPVAKVQHLGNYAALDGNQLVLLQLYLKMLSDNLITTYPKRLCIISSQDPQHNMLMTDISKHHIVWIGQSGSDHLREIFKLLAPVKF